MPEAFSWATLLLGPLWLVAQGFWLAGIAILAAAGGLCLWLPQAAPVFVAAAHLMAACIRHDLERAALRRQGLPIAGVVVAESRDAAILRLWSLRPELARGLVR